MQIFEDIDAWLSLSDHPLNSGLGRNSIMLGHVARLAVFYNPMRDSNGIESRPGLESIKRFNDNSDRNQYRNKENIT